MADYATFTMQFALPFELSSAQHCHFLIRPFSSPVQHKNLFHFHILPYKNA